MLTDKNGEPLKVGDRVYIPCTVVGMDEVQENNLSLESEEVAAPGKNKVPFAVGSKLVILGTKHDKTLGVAEEADPRLSKHSAKTAGTSPVADLNASEAIDHISRMHSKDKLQEIIDHDPRVTVQKAAQEKLEALK